MQIKTKQYTGRISYLSINDLTVEITSPYKNLTNGVHIPYFALHKVQFKKYNKPTEYAIKRAYELLEELYNVCKKVEDNKEQIKETILNTPKEQKYDEITDIIKMQTSEQTLNDVVEKLIKY